METHPTTTNRQAVCYSGKSPSLFSIPLDVYSNEMERERDKESFLKIQQLEKKCEQLRQKLRSYTERHATRIERTKQLVSQSREYNKNIYRRKDQYWFVN